MTSKSQLRRSSYDRRIAGVAGGLSDFLGIDSSLIRVLFVLGTIFGGGAGLFIYLGCWIFMPAADSSSPRSRARHVPLWVFIIFLIIAANMIGHNAYIIAAMVVVVLVALVWGRLRHRRSWRTSREFEKARLAWQRRIEERTGSETWSTYAGDGNLHIDSFFPQPDNVVNNPATEPNRNDDYPLYPAPGSRPDDPLGNNPSGFQPEH